MSFSWWCHDKDGKDLFKEFGVNSQALGLGPNTASATEAPNRVSDIRSAWMHIPYKDKLEDAAQEALATVQALALENKASLKREPHCPTCKCECTTGYRTPHFWDIDSIDRLLSVPIERVWRAGGGH
jgi:hypothetical protein